MSSGGIEPRWRRRTAIVATGTAVAAAAGGWMGMAEASSPPDDVSLLNSALVLEELQVAFYSSAIHAGRLRGELGQYARIVGGHEREHVAYPRRLLGSRARPAPAFDFGPAVSTPSRFARTARLLEDLGVAAYDGQAPGLSKASLAAVARVVSVEARHAAWIRDILGETPAPDAGNPAFTAAQVTAVIARTGFIKGVGS